MSDDYTPWESDYPSDTAPYEAAPSQDSAGFFDGGGAYASGIDKAAMAADIAAGLESTGITSPWLTTGDFARADRAAYGAQPTAETTGTFGKFGKFLTDAGDLANKYKTPLELLAGGLAFNAKAKNNEKAAQRLSDSRIAELNLKDQQAQQADARYSDSLKGLRPAGLIVQDRLKRVGGGPVFAGNGIINRA